MPPIVHLDSIVRAYVEVEQQKRRRHGRWHVDLGPFSPLGSDSEEKTTLLLFIHTYVFIRAL